MADYTPHTWADDVGGGTPLDAATLNEMETGIDRASIPTKVTSLPGSPYDGQEVYYEAADGVYWHLRYRSASASSYKWEYLGGAALQAEVSTIETTTSASYADLATVGPSVTLPLAGEYEIEFSLSLKTSAAGATMGQAAPTYGAAASDVDAAQQQSANNYITVGRKIVRTVAAASQLVKLQYKSDGSATLTASNRVISIRPVRVG